MMPATLGRRCVFAAAALVTLFVVCLTLTFHQPTYRALKYHTGFAPKQYDLHGFATGNGPLTVPHTHPANAPAAHDAPKYAYVTLLSGTVHAEEDLAKDNYFVAVRILIWQLLHSKPAKSQPSLPPPSLISLPNL